MAKVTLAPNVPVPMSVKYCDLIDSQYGVQYRFKGATPHDDDAVLYADLAHASGELVACGALRAAPDVPAELPKNGLALRLQVRALTFVKEQPAGQRTGQLRIVAGDVVAAAAEQQRRGVRGAAPEAKPATAPVASSAPPSAPERRPLSAVYLECVDVVLKRVVPQLTKAGLSVTDAGVAAMTTSLFTRRCQEER